MSLQGAAFDDDPGKSVQLNFELSLGSDLHLLLDWFTDEVIDHYSLRTRPSTINQIRAAMDCLLANLMHANQLNPECFVSMSRRTGSYTRNRYRQLPFGHANLIRAVDYLRESNPPYVSFYRGFNDRRGRAAIGRNSRIRATEKLLHTLRGYSNLITKGYFEIEGVIERGNELQELPGYSTETPLPITGRISIPSSHLVISPPPESIRLKDSDRRLMEYADTDETRAMRERLERWNEFADLNLIDLFITDDQLDTLYDDALDEDVEEAAFYSDDKDKPSYVDFTRHRLHRVFNNGSFKEGGRFYGGWWIWVPSRYRNYIMINAAPTKEIDYSNLHAAMLYAREGLPLQEDAYSLDGVDDQYRKLIKATFFKLINALEGQRIRPPRQDALPPDLSWRELQDAIMEKHEPIAQHFQSGIGLELQRTDSDIAEEVMLTMMERNILVLPVHDSFVAYAAQEDSLREVMAEAYKRHMQGSIGMEADPGFLELEVPEETREADQLGVINLVDVVGEFERREGYSGYRERKRAFLADKDEAWRWRFYPRS